MREKVKALIGSLESTPPPLPADEVSEGRRLLEWMEARHFVFLGYRYYKLERGSNEDRLVPYTRTGLGVLRNGGTCRYPLRLQRYFAASSQPCTGKGAVDSDEGELDRHRASGEYLDYIGVKSFDERGRVNGEHRFLGLWTSTAYHRSPRDIPVLRRKVERVIEYFGLD